MTLCSTFSVGWVFYGLLTLIPIGAWNDTAGNPERRAHCPVPWLPSTWVQEARSVLLIQGWRKVSAAIVCAPAQLPRCKDKSLSAQNPPYLPWLHRFELRTLRTSHGCMVTCFGREGSRTFPGRRVSNSYVLSQEGMFLPASCYSRATDRLGWISKQYIELWKWSLSISSLFHHLLWQAHINVYRCLYSTCGVTLPGLSLILSVCICLSVCQESWAFSLSEDASRVLISFSSNATIFHNLLQRVYAVA